MFLNIQKDFLPLKRLNYSGILVWETVKNVDRGKMIIWTFLWLFEEEQSKIFCP